MRVYMEYLLYHFCVCNRGWGWVWGKFLNPWWQNLKRFWGNRIIYIASVQHLTNFSGFASPTKVQETAVGELSMPSWDYSISDGTEALHKLLLRKHRITWPFWGSQWLLCHLLFISIPFSGRWNLWYNLLLQHLGQCPTCFQACQSWQVRGNLWGNSGVQTLTGFQRSLSMISRDFSSGLWSLWLQNVGDR